MKPLRIFLFMLFFIAGCKRENVPKIATVSISSITQTTATCLGNVISRGDCEITSKGFYIGTSYNLSSMDSVRVNGSSTGNYTYNKTNLDPGTKYFVRAFAANCYGTGYGDTISFTTEPATLPEVVTYQYIPVSQTSASLYGEIFSNGASEIVDCGFCWSTSENLTLSDNCVSSNLHSGKFSATIAGIEPNTKYYVRAYATNQAVGTGYGNSEYFTTCSDVPNMSLIGTWQQVSDLDCGYRSSLPTKIEITSDSLLTLSSSGDIWVSSFFRIKACVNWDSWDSVYFYNPPALYLYIKLIDCNDLQLHDPHQLSISTPCEYFKRIE